MSKNILFNDSIKNLVQINRDFEIKYDQHIENIEATQRIIVEKVGGIRSLVELNYKEILKNRHEILENRKQILNKISTLEEKIDKISEKV